MIAWLSGVVRVKNPDAVVVDVGGVGYQVHLSLNSYYKVGPVGSKIEASILTYVREDQITLYGFLVPGEKESHAHLMTVSGIGPKLALNILSGIKPEELAEAVATANLKRLTAAPGVGKKIAERIVIELKDKLSMGGSGSSLAAMPLPLAPSPSAPGVLEDLQLALASLGYKKPEVDMILPKLKLTPETTLEVAIKEALRLMRPRTVG